jgi:hypothetical protein
LKLKIKKSKNQKNKTLSQMNIQTLRQTQISIPSNPSSRITQKNHPTSQIISEKDKGVQTRRRIIKDTEQSHIAFISMVEPKTFNEASEDENWLK